MSQTSVGPGPGQAAAVGLQARAAGLPDGLLLAYYGDDFTGSTDALESLAATGLPTALFLQPPTPAELKRFAGLRCVGVAGQSRGQSPEWMRRELPAVFAALRALRPALLHYKVCSTFDSSPEIGSIGCAIDLGQACCAGRWVPVLVGAPRLRRYQVFGNLFATTSDGATHRLDRHATMARHPVTPMRESDLRMHLARQTSSRIALLDLLSLRQDAGAARLQALLADGPPPVVLLDVLDDATLAAAGERVWAARGEGLFCAASSGLGDALAAHWRHQGWLPAPQPLPCARPVDRVAVVSGSCSPVTAMQVRHARGQGFATIRLDLARALHPAGHEAEVGRCVDAAIRALRAGDSVVVFSAEGPDDPAVQVFEHTAATLGMSRHEAGQRTGGCLAAVMHQLLDQVPLQRVAVAGGDSSGEVVSRLGIRALTVVAGLAPGAPLVRAWSDDPRRDGLQLALKGGQMGGAHFFSELRDGGPAAPPTAN